MTSLLRLSMAKDLCGSFTKASIAHRGVECSSLKDERVLQDAAKLVSYLRHAFIKTFEIDCSELDAETTRSLLELKDYFVIDNLKLRSKAFHLIDGALVCRTLIWQSRNYDLGGSEVEQDYGDYEDYDENKIKELNKRYAFLEDFFKLRTVRNAENLELLDIWLHGDDAKPCLSEARELHVWWDSYQGNEINALIARFRSDKGSREYKFVASGECVCAGRILSQKLENDFGDVFEVDVNSAACSNSVTVTRYRGENAKRTSLVQSMDGPKVWAFRTPRELEKHILGNNVYELLARSRLIANEMICKCGSRMNLQIMRRWWDREGAIWRCSGNCKNRFGETLHVMPTFGSWFLNFGQQLYGEVATVLKLVTLLASGSPDADGAAKLHAPGRWKKMLELHDDLLKHEDINIEDPIERFYMAVMRKKPYDAPFVLPDLQDWYYY